MSEPATWFTFEAAGEWCAGWYHAPMPPWRDMAIVLCGPMGNEGVCSYPTQVQLAHALADAGFPVLRFQYHGTGDSAGDAEDPARVQAWEDSAQQAIAQARLRSEATSVALLGIRLGATLALEAAARVGGIDSVLLWAPCASGKAFVRELRAAGLARHGGGVHAFGERYSPATLVDLQALDPAAGNAAPARRALVIGRDDLPIEGPLPKALRAQGVEVDYRVLPGYAAMVDEPRAGVLEAATLEAVCEWFAQSPAAARRADTPAAAAEDLAGRCTGAVQEAPVRFGTRGSLFGVLAEPAAGRAADRLGQTGVLLLNVGGNPHFGPHRIYVAMARAFATAGFAVLRMDIAGIGDSDTRPGQPAGSLYLRESVPDVGAAVDAMVQRGCREIVLVGLCSGSYLAFQSALADERVDAIVLMNARLLEWMPGRPGDTWHSSMQQYAKSSDYYRRALFTAEAWAKLVQGQVHVRLIARRLLSLAGARLRRSLPFGAREETLLRKMQRLCERGTDVLMLVSDADDGRDYVEFHFGPDGRRMEGQPGFRMAYVPEADHTFSRPGNRDHVIPELLRSLAQRRPRGSVATQNQDAAAPARHEATPTAPL